MEDEIKVNEPVEVTEAEVKEAVELAVETATENVVVESVPAAENAKTVVLEETSVVEVSPKVNRNRKGLSKECYQHSVETYKKGDKIDFFVAFCGVFALGCLGVSAYNVYRYGFDWIFGLMMAGYLLVALFCLVKPLYYILARFSWNLGFGGRLKAAKSGKPVRFDDNAVTISLAQDRTIYYETMIGGYETEEYFVFHCSEGCIVPIDKESVAEAEKEFENTDLTEYFRELINKANDPEPDEPAPNITR